MVNFIKRNPNDNRKKIINWLIDESGLLDDVEGFSFPNGGNRESSWVLIKEKEYTWHQLENGVKRVLK